MGFHLDVRQINIFHLLGLIGAVTVPSEFVVPEHHDVTFHLLHHQLFPV